MRGMVGEGMSRRLAGDRFFKGSGTSQAAAVMAGAAALYFQKYPTAKPDQFRDTSGRATTSASAAVPRRRST
jgi:serine protease AprX